MSELSYVNNSNGSLVVMIVLDMYKTCVILEKLLCENVLRMA